MSFASIPSIINKKSIMTNELELKTYFDLRQKKSLKHSCRCPIDIYYTCVMLDNGTLYFYYFGENKNTIMLLGSGGYIPIFHRNNKDEIIHEFFQKSLMKYAALFRPTPKHILNNMHIRTKHGISDKFGDSLSVPEIPLDKLYCQLLKPKETKYYFDQRAAEALLPEDQKILKFSRNYKSFSHVYYICYNDSGVSGVSGDCDIKFTYFIEIAGDVFIVGSGGYIPQLHSDCLQIYEFCIDSLKNTSLELCVQERKSLLLLH